MTETAPAGQYAEHSTPYAGPVDRAYALISDVTRWPLLFDPCVHTDVIEHSPGSDHFRMWAIVGDGVQSWTSRRTFDDDAARIDFQQQNSKEPLASMGGHWRVDTAGEENRLVLAHHWELSEDSPQARAWVADAMERNSTAELAAVRSWAGHADFDDLVFGFEEHTDIAAPVAAVYDFLHRSDLWPQRLDHVIAVEMASDAASELTGGAEVQRMRMDTAAAPESVHTSRSIRLCFPHERIVYKQTTVPRPLSAHSGEWLLVPRDGGVRAVARHQIALDPGAIEDYFGADTTPAEARRRVRDLLGRNSLATLEHARAHAGG